MTTIKTRKPTGAVPWPLILIEGGEKAGKSWQLAEFTTDERIGQAYWIDLGEGSADEYAAIEGTDYLVVDHDGTWRDILDQVKAIRYEAERANKAGEKPVVLFIDSMTAEWDQLKDWVGTRARQSKYAKAQLARDPDAEIKPAMNLWNDANDRHNRLMHLLMTFPGIVVVTARGKMVAALDGAGKPIPNEKEYKVEGHKNLAFDASAWVRLSRDEAPKVIGVRSVAHGIRPGVDKPIPAPSFSVSWLVFDILKCDPSTAQVRDLQELDHSADPAPEDTAARPQQNNRPPAKSSADVARQALGMAPPERDAVDAQAAALRKDIDNATTKEELKALWMAAGELTPDYTGDLRARAEAKVADLDALAAANAAENLQTELGAQPVPEQSAA